MLTNTKIYLKYRRLYKNTFLHYPLQPIKLLYVFYLKRLKSLYDFYNHRLIPEKYFIKKRYKEVFGVDLNMKRPQKFTEKMQWLKLNDRTPLHTICADKYKVKEYVKERIGAEFLIPLVFETKNVKDICQENLPDYAVIIKTNHDSGGTFVVKDKHSANFSLIQKSLKKRLKKNFYNVCKEWEYKNIEPRIIVEKLMTDSSGNDRLNDYKIHCFNGEPRYIQTIFDRVNDVKENWFDINWNLQEFYYFSDKKAQIEMPANLNKMVEIASILSSAFVYVRVDLYCVVKKIYFGEMTFRPWGGFMRWQPKKYDFILGKYLQIPVSNINSK